MLKITVENQQRPLTLCLAGKLAGPWVDELQQVWNSARREGSTGKITVDLFNVTFVDEKGKEILASMLDEGAQFENPQLLTRYIVDELKSVHAAHTK